MPTCRNHYPLTRRTAHLGQPQALYFCILMDSLTLVLTAVVDAVTDVFMPLYGADRRKEARRFTVALLAVVLLLGASAVLLVVLG